MNIEEIKEKIKQALDEYSEEIIKIGDTVLENPELGYREEKTSKYVRDIFDKLGIEYIYPCALTGV